MQTGSESRAEVSENPNTASELEASGSFKVTGIVSSNKRGHAVLLVSELEGTSHWHQFVSSLRSESPKVSWIPDTIMLN